MRLLQKVIFLICIVAELQPEVAIAVTPYYSISKLHRYIVKVLGIRPDSSSNVQDSFVSAAESELDPHLSLSSDFYSKESVALESDLQSRENASGDKSPSMKALTSHRTSNFFIDTQLQLTSAVGKFISIDKDYSQIALFAPLAFFSKYKIFLDLQAYRFSKGKWASSVGFVFRKPIDSYRVLGINTYYDYRQGEYNKKFYRLGLGIEWLANCFDLRFNGYLPIGRYIEHPPTHLYTYPGDYFAIFQRVQSAYQGCDVEISRSLYRYCDLNLYGAIGPYYFYVKRFSHFWGGQAKLELSWRSLLSLQLRTSYDCVYHGKTQGCLEFNIPLDLFCFKNLIFSEINKWMQLVKRNGIILLYHRESWIWNW